MGSQGFADQYRHKAIMPQGSSQQRQKVTVLMFCCDTVCNECGVLLRIRYLEGQKKALLSR